MANEINIVVSAQVGDATKGLMQVQQQVQRVDRQIKNSTKILSSNANQYNRNAVATNKWAKGALQQAGYQVGDFAVQLSGGQNALQAFGQQGSQLLGIFGPVGAILGAGVAIFAAFGVAVQRSGAEVSDMGKALGVLQEPLSQVAGAVKGLTSSFGSAFPTLVQNIDTALIAVGLLAGLTVAKMVPSMLAASGASTMLTASLATYRAGLVAATLNSVTLSSSLVALTTRAGVFSGALYGVSAGLGRVAFAFGAVKAAVMTLGVALKAVGKIFLRFLPVAAIATLALAIKGFLQLRKGAGSFGEALGLLGDVVKEFFSRLGLRIENITQKWTVMTGGLKARFLQAMLYLGEQFDDFIQGFVAKWNSTIGSRAEALKINIGWSLADQLREAVTDIDSEMKVAEARIEEIAASLNLPNEAVARLLEAFRNGKTEIDIFGDATENAAIKGANALKDQLTPAMKQAIAVGDMVGNSMENAMMSIVDGTKSVKDAFKSMASEIIKELYRIFVVKKITGMIADSISFMAGPKTGNTGSLGLPSFAGGGYTGGGSRSGGLDGKGGYMAMVHPRETVVDHTKGQSASGGNVTVNQTINVSTGVQQTVRTEIRTLMPQIAEAAKSAVADAKLRGGSYGRSFA